MKYLKCPHCGSELCISDQDGYGGWCGCCPYKNGHDPVFGGSYASLEDLKVAVNTIDNGWIPVDDLPEPCEYDEYICIDEYGVYWMCVFVGEWMCLGAVAQPETGEITHYMPLPEPPCAN